MQIKTVEEYQELTKEGVVLVDFFATWCGPCKMLAPVLDEVEKEAENVKILKVDVDKFPELASKFNVMSIPTLVLLKNEEVVKISNGFMPKPAVLKFIDEAF